MRILFMGTPDFAVPSLQRLCEDGHELCAVFTQPDKPVGRKRVITAPPVKCAALKQGIPVFQPARIREQETLEQLRVLKPELIVVVAYGQILPQELLDIPEFGCINVHGSLLPQYRGSAPVQRAVMAGERVTGVTTMKMDAGVDTGDMLLKIQTEVYPNETGGELYNRLSYIGAKALHDTLEQLIDGVLTPVKQEESLSSYAPMLTKRDSPIDWSKPANAVHNQVRGLNPWPSAQTTFDGRTLKIHETELSCDKYPKAAPGEIVLLSPLTVVCGDGGAVSLLQLQMEGGKRMSSEAFLNGNRMQPGTRLGG